MHHTDELDDTERTTDELFEAMASGNVIQVIFGDAFAFHISLSGVALFTRHDLAPEEITELVAGTARGVLDVDPTPSCDSPIAVDPGEAALLDRALAARRALVGA
ncbi:hypothetical protein [Streptomyces sp. NBC_01304]|uniref:hypothetical protein n=1 Tax=Streptomyces sp. NBC_01304 TaxID=2903818 RepID=UPI002E12EB5A|nr:hypothetical protein OG430_47770 [Streptomyces sp. NBC_01304]